jgi:hypothetical protein
VPDGLRAHNVVKLPTDTQEAPRSGPAPHHRGLSLRPRDAVDPYALGRFAPDTCGIQQVGIWCPHCNSSLLVVEMLMTEHGLYIEAVCQTCSNPNRDRPGIYKRLRIPLAWGKLPDVEE